jgi:Raf kinase inhibitor-like YbhB/YbcL family protein
MLIMAFELQIEGFSRGKTIPLEFTCDGANRSPALTWSGAPAETKSFALVMDDPDAPRGIWTHWLLWDIPTDMFGIKEDAHLQAPIVTGSNDFGDTGYGGPCPPKGHGQHRYVFRLLALDLARLDLPPGANRSQFDEALGRHAIAAAEFMGRFERT